MPDTDVPASLSLPLKMFKGNASPVVLPPGRSAGQSHGRSSRAPTGGPSPTSFKIPASKTPRVADLAPARARRAAAMTSRTGPALGQRRKGRGTPLAAVSFPQVLAVAGGLAAGRVEERRRQGRCTAAEIAWHPPTALPLDGSMSSRELCAGTSSTGRAQPTVRLALQ
jgi:hypothetical protein